MSSVPPTDIVYRVLRLEQQLDSYQRLHAEELEQIRRALAELKAQVLALAAQKENADGSGGKRNVKGKSQLRLANRVSPIASRMSRKDRK